jgi:type IV pilus assembly protein PilB
MARPKLGQVLIMQGSVTDAELEAALDTQRTTGERIGRILVEEGVITEIQLVQALAAASGVDFVDLSEKILDPTASRRIPEPFARRSKAVPIAWDGDRLIVAMVNPSDVFTLDDIRTMAGVSVKPVMVEERQLIAALEGVWRNGSDAEAMLQLATDEIEDDEVGGIIDSTADAPVVQFVNELLTRAVHERASDIHLEPTGQSLRVRFRVDGVTHDVMNVPRQLQAPVISRLKIMGDINIAEHRLPQDGRVTMALDNRAVDIRMVTLPTAFGEAFVLRILDRDTALRPISELGFMPEPFEAYTRAYSQPYGAILVTGPTGSGKSSTLYATLNEINDPGRTIVTVEDPIEYRMPGIKQVQLNTKAGLTFASALRSILRADPDVVLVGEVRDVETARIAIEAALTGHKVLTSLHTNSAAATPARLVDMGVEPYLVTSALSCVLAQRLVRQLCKCREPFEPEAAELEAAGWPPGARPAIELENRFCRAKGCDLCGGTGYRGRFAAFEVMPMSAEINHLVLQRASAAEVAKCAVEQGMLSMRMDALRKAAAGLTTIEEVLRVIPAG